MRYKMELLLITLLVFPLSAVYAAHKVTNDDEYAFVIMSDPQAWRLERGDPNSKKNKAPWEQRNRTVINSLNMLNAITPIKFGIINGDITEFGRPKTRKSFYGLYNQLVFPFYIGLGNHDYANNVGDCTIPESLHFSKNSCAWSATADIVDKLTEYKNVLSNFSSDIHGLRTKFIGSMAYSWDMGSIHFVQLHNYPTYEVRLKSYALRFHVEIINSLQWLERDLKAARSRNKHIILNFHDGYQHFTNETTPAQKKQFREILEKYKVTAVFSGHAHFQFESYFHDDELYGNTPLFVAGALFMGEYYLVKVKKDGLSIIAYNGVNGVPLVAKQLNDLKYAD